VRATWRGCTLCSMDERGQSSAQHTARRAPASWLAAAALTAAAQVRGRKRLLLWEPDALGDLQLYPAWHMLRRRARVCPARGADLAANPRFAASRVLEAALEPGDVLCLPPRWAHYTESLTLSASVTYRFRPRLARRSGCRPAAGAAARARVRGPPCCGAALR